VPTADFFARLGREEKDTPYGNALFGYVASHPMSAARELARAELEAGRIQTNYVLVPRARH
jgi:hypothetical protein